MTVFAMYAAGLRKPAENLGVDREAWKQVDDSRRQSLRAIAEPTAGFAVLDHVDFADAMPHIRAAAMGTSK